MSYVGVLGGGNWGTSLSILLSRASQNVKLWEFFPERAEAMRKWRENKIFLPGVIIPEDIFISSNLDEIVKDCSVIFLVVPSHLLRSLLSSLKNIDFSPDILVSAIKGIETDSLLRISEIVENEMSWDLSKFAVISGPSIAVEAVCGIPTAVVSASKDISVAKRVQKILTQKSFRVYTSDDVIGVELGGALKNIIAIASGICDGLGFGDNSRGALITRGLAEITRLGVALGAKHQTFAGLSGMGDLVTTCSSRYSRNHRVGEEIAKGKGLNEILANLGMVAEGVNTTRAARALANKCKIEMPITEEVYQVLFCGKDPKDAAFELMAREPKKEG